MDRCQTCLPLAVCYWVLMIRGILSHKATSEALAQPCQREWELAAWHPPNIVGLASLFGGLLPFESEAPRGLMESVSSSEAYCFWLEPESLVI
uniref:EC47 protein n=1 Tax=Colletotrichum higginsianum TaxID=80884 RepID=I2G7C6_9PEZI|nr:EC47 protein [Colletotrichum higginsianum]